MLIESEKVNVVDTRHKPGLRSLSQFPPLIFFTTKNSFFAERVFIHKKYYFFSSSLSRKEHYVKW